MMNLCAALPVLAALPAAVGPQAGQGTPEVPFEETLLATIPADLALEGEPRVGPDGKSYPTVHRVAWSPNGRSVAYVGMRGGKNHPVLGEQVLDGFDFADPPRFSANGEHVAFRVGNTRSKKSEQWWVLVDGEEAGSDDWIGAVAVTNAGEPVYWKMPGTKLDKSGVYDHGPARWVTTFKQGKKWKDANALTPTQFSADEKTFATVAQGKDQQFVVLLADRKGEREGSESFPFISGFALSPDGKALAIAAMDPQLGRGFGRGGGPGGGAAGGFDGRPPGLKQVIALGDNRFGTEYDDAGAPTFTPDGMHVAYKVRKGKQMDIALDGDPGVEPRWTFVQTPVFDARSKYIAYVVKDGGEINAFLGMYPGALAEQVTGGRTLLVTRALDSAEPAVSAEYEAIRHPVFGPEDGQVAFCARDDEGWHVVVGETVSPAYSEVGPPTFSADGERVAFGARSDREIWWRVLELASKPDTPLPD